MEGDFDKAREFYEKAYSLDAENPIIIASMADSKLKTGETEEAIRLFSSALEKSSDTYFRAEMLCDLSSIVLAGTGKTNVGDAFGYANRAIQENPDFAPARFALGKAFTEMGQYDRAIEEIDRGLQAYSSSSDGLRFRGIANLLQGDSDNAIYYLDKSLRAIGNDIGIMGYERLPRAGETLYYLSWAYAAKGDRGKTVFNMMELLRSGNLNYVFKMMFQLSSPDYGIYAPLSKDPDFVRFVETLKKDLLVNK